MLKVFMTREQLQELIEKHLDIDEEVWVQYTHENGVQQEEELKHLLWCTSRKLHHIRIDTFSGRIELHLEPVK